MHDEMFCTFSNSVLRGYESVPVCVCVCVYVCVCVCVCVRVRGSLRVRLSESV